MTNTCYTPSKEEPSVEHAYDDSNNPSYYHAEDFRLHLRNDFNRVQVHARLETRGRGEPVTMNRVEEIARKRHHRKNREYDVETLIKASKQKYDQNQSC